MSHYYIETEDGPRRFRPLKKDGTEYLRIPQDLLGASGAAKGVTDALKSVGDDAGLMHWATGIGIAAGIRSVEEGVNPKELAKEMMDRTSNEGTAIHDAIENYLKTGLVPDEPILCTAGAEALRWLTEHGFEPPYHTEKCLFFRGYVDGVKLAFGGTTDLVFPTAIVDWKSIEDSGRGFREPRWKEAAQTAIYRMAAHEMGLCSADADAWNVYFDRKTGKIVSEIRWTEAAMKHGLALLPLACRVSHEIELIEGCIKRRKHDPSK